MEKKYYRAKEAAQYLGIARSTIWMYAAKGMLTRIKLSPRVSVFDIDDLNNLLNGSSTGESHG